MRRIFFIVAIVLVGIIRSASAQILAESFRNMACTNCSVVDSQYEAYSAANPQYKIQIINVHDNFPDPNDPFYIVSASAANARSSSSLYNIQSDPTFYIDGYLGGSGADCFGQCRTTTQDIVAAGNPNTITASASVDGSGIMQIDLHANGNTKGKQVRPYVMLIESGISYVNKEAYGNVPNDIWNNILRDIIPSPSGGDAFALNGTQDLHYSYDPTGKPWVLNNCKIVAFLQEVTPQSSSNNFLMDAVSPTIPIATEGVSTSNNMQSVSVGIASPNPFPSVTEVSLLLPNPAYVKAIVSNSLGIEVATIVDGFVSTQSSILSFDPRGLSAGSYYISVMVNGVLAGVRPVLYEP